MHLKNNIVLAEALTLGTKTMSCQLEKSEQGSKLVLKDILDFHTEETVSTIRGNRNLVNKYGIKRAM